MHSLRHILVGTDFTPASEAALDAAIVLAQLALAQITLVHVCELGALGDDLETIAHSRQGLESVQASHRDRGVAIATLVRSGRPADKINNAAAEVGASLIVLGHLGAVADRVLRTSNRPVLVVGAKPVEVV